MAVERAKRKSEVEGPTGQIFRFCLQTIKQGMEVHPLPLRSVFPVQCTWYDQGNDQEEVPTV